MADTVTSGEARVELSVRFSRFKLPPVESALVIGRRALIGPNAMANALGEMMPGAFKLIAVEHPVIEAVILRAVHLNRVPEPKLVALLLRNAERFMSEQDTLHFEIDVEVHVRETVEL